MAYESAPLTRMKVRYNSDNADNPIIFQLVRYGAKVTPASAVISVYAKGSSTALVDEAAMSISGTTLLTYSIDTTTVASWPIADGYRVDVVVTDANENEYVERIYVDVVKVVPQGKITRDQLVKVDERVLGMQWADDSDLSELILGVWEEVQLAIESRTVDGDYMTDDMIVDRAKLSIPARHLCLSRLHRSKGNLDDAKYFEGLYNDMMRSILSGGVRMDLDQDGDEDTEAQNSMYVRLTN